MRRFLSLVAFFSATIIISAQSNNTHPDYMYSISMDSTKVGQMQMTKEAKAEANKNAIFAAGTAIRASADWQNIAIGSGVVAGAVLAIGAGKDNVAPKIVGFSFLGFSLVSEVVSIVMKYNAGRSLQIAAGKITYTF